MGGGALGGQCSPSLGRPEGPRPAQGSRCRGGPGQPCRRGVTVVGACARSLVARGRRGDPAEQCAVTVCVGIH